MITRRTFVYSAALGTLQLGLGVPGAGQTRTARDALKIDVQAPDIPLSPLAMPGLFPGRVVEVIHPAPIVARRVSQPAVR